MQIELVKLENNVELFAYYYLFCSTKIQMKILQETKRIITEKRRKLKTVILTVSD